MMRHLMKPVEDRVRLMLSRAIVGLIDDNRTAQALQLDLLSDETQDDVERFQNYGFTSHPHPGAEALVGFVGGLRSHGIVFAVEDRRYRARALQQGEVAIYDDLGNMVLLGREAITVTGVARVEVAAPVVLVDSADLRLGGEGGAKIARVGDDVDLGTGKIITGSDKVTAA
ncbi:MAG: phage baseplate assembly protein [Sphingomonadales bacterium]|nr:phage baseplate assembly protein [Sphingomonadales bacterium]